MRLSIILLVALLANFAVARIAKRQANDIESEFEEPSDEDNSVLVDPAATEEQQSDQQTAQTPEPTSTVVEEAAEPFGEDRDVDRQEQEAKPTVVEEAPEDFGNQEEQEALAAENAAVAAEEQNGAPAEVVQAEEEEQEDAQVEVTPQEFVEQAEQQNEEEAPPEQEQETVEKGNEPTEAEGEEEESQLTENNSNTVEAQPEQPEVAPVQGESGEAGGAQEEFTDDDETVEEEKGEVVEEEAQPEEEVSETEPVTPEETEGDGDQAEPVEQGNGQVEPDTEQDVVEEQTEEEEPKEDVVTGTAETVDAPVENEDEKKVVVQPHPKPNTSAPWTDSFGWTHYPWKNAPCRKYIYVRTLETGCQIKWIKKVYKRFHPKPRVILTHSCYYMPHRHYRCPCEMAFNRHHHHRVQPAHRPCRFTRRPTRYVRPIVRHTFTHHIHKPCHGQRAHFASHPIFTRASRFAHEAQYLPAAHFGYAV